MKLIIDNETSYSQKIHLFTIKLIIEKNLFVMNPTIFSNSFIFQYDYLEDV